MKTSLINLESKVGVIAPPAEGHQGKARADADLGGGEEHLELPTQNLWGTVFSNPPSRPSRVRCRGSPLLASGPTGMTLWRKAHLLYQEQNSKQFRFPSRPFRTQTFSVLPRQDGVLSLYEKCGGA